MGLIDANKVKEYILKEGFYCDTKADREAVVKEIDSLFPTVEAIPIEWIEKWVNMLKERNYHSYQVLAPALIEMLGAWEKENN